MPRCLEWSSSKSQIAQCPPSPGGDGTNGSNGQDGGPGGDGLQCRFVFASNPRTHRFFRRAFQFQVISAFVWWILRGRHHQPQAPSDSSAFPKIPFAKISLTLGPQGDNSLFTNNFGLIDSPFHPLLALTSTASLCLFASAGVKGKAVSGKRWQAHCLFPYGL